MGTDDGSWIVPDGEYQDLVRDLCGSDPRLRRPDEKMSRYGVYWSSRQCRVVVLEFQDNASGGAAATTPLEFSDAETLRQYLSKPSEKHNNTVYIVEGANRDFVGVLGPHFGLHPSVFMDYERITTVAVPPDRGQSSLLASNYATRDYLCLSYQELAFLPEQVRDKFRARCPETARIIRGTRLNGKFGSAGLIHRRCIFWSRKKPAGDGWDSIVICDPPLRRIRILDEGPMKGLELAVSPGLPGDGYIDFVPLDAQARCRRGPPRTCIADDLLFYLTTHCSLVDMKSPTSVSVFLKKIIASHYTKHFDYLRKNVMEALRGMGRQSDFARFDLSAVEANWSDTQTLERRLGHFFLDLEEILVQLRVPLEPPDHSKINSWQDVEADFRFLYHRFNWIRQSVHAVNASITGLAGIAGNRQAFREQQLSLQSAERSRNLTFIGLIFIPLSLISSLFSMAEPYGPGQHKFWIYFVICIPAAILVVTAYYVSDLLVSSGRAALDYFRGLPTVRPRLRTNRTVEKMA
ncbi:Mg2+ transporter zinc transport protein [Pleurostoma richardsiae]|uniref:Mg2+ transporter zinc transport protein n=1 Tax=Pleurostoma richardsiae TaxID=41990 RepID=A0AA38SDG1_9PEZI|nr:Mg2+ transporter zinc transport protein [Pleurostoma richardsiae]